MPLIHWASETPTNPGWYWLEYTGYRSQERRTDIVEIGAVPAGRMLPEGSMAHVERDRYGDVWHREIRFHEDCQPVRWAGPISEPIDASHDRPDTDDALDKDYVAWLVERRDMPGALRYLAFNSIGEPVFVDCADDACHFARKADAMQWAESETMELHVCDHQWPGGTPRDPVIQQYEWRKDDAN